MELCRGDGGTRAEPRIRELTEEWNSTQARPRAVAESDLPFLMARQMHSCVAGMSKWVTPNSLSASTTALITAARAGVVPPSPPARTPSGLDGEGTSIRSVLKNGRLSDRGIA